MNIDIDLNNKILIIPNNIKTKVVKNINNLPKLSNVKILTDQEFITNLTIDYNEKAIIYLMNNKNLSYQNAKEILKNIKYATNDNNDCPKLQELTNIKNELLEKNLLIINKQFIPFIKDKEIIFYGFDYINKFIKKLITDNNLKVNIIEKEYQNINPKVYLFDNVSSEIEYIAEDIISKNLDLSQTYIYGINNDNKLIIDRIFKSYGIPINLNYDNTLYNTFIGKELLNNLNNIDEFLSKIKDDKIKKAIINILNKYYFVDNYQDINNVVKEELKQTKINNTKIRNAVNEIDIINNVVEKGDNVYIINFNSEYIPVINKDVDYISDNEKPSFLETSTELNNINKEILNKVIRNINNLTITASQNNYNGPLNISTIATDYDYEIIPMETKISKYSNKINKYNLTNMLDNYLKYNNKNDNQDILLNTYPDLRYKDYNNTYTKVQATEEFSLSYSKMNSFYECPFKYYCDNILKLDTYEDTFDTYIGSLCHYILSKIYTDNFDFDAAKKEFLETNSYQVTNENLLFQNKILEELKTAISYILSMQNVTKFNEIECERKIETTINETKFVGIIDKIQKYQNKIILIDYKTGNPKINLKECQYGFNLQLPTYIYLVKTIYPDSQIVGVYLEHILKPKFNFNMDKSDNESFENSLKLEGYSTSNEKILEEIDSTYENSMYIKGIKKKSDGFYKYAKILSNEEFEELEKLVTEKINNCITEIKNNNFDIKPIILNQTNKSCPNCKYASICFHTEKDNVYIDTKGDDENAELD